MKLDRLQTRLQASGRYFGEIDGDYGLLTQSAILTAMTDGPDTAVTLADMTATAARIKVQTAAIRAFWSVEANGAGFFQGRPKILPEPHRFSRNTGHAFDGTDPRLSYRKWGTLPYPPTQQARWEMLCAWVRILSARDMDIDAAFMSASFGAPQIMGENFDLCGYPDAFAFAEAMAQDEKMQLLAFVDFVDHAGILPDLCKVDRTPESWRAVAKRYNGTAYEVNEYHLKMAKAFAAFGGK